MKIAVTTLAFCVAALLALGLVMLYSSSMTQVGAHYLMMQLLWAGVGMTLCVSAAMFDYRLLKKFAWPIFAVAMVLLVVVLNRYTEKHALFGLRTPVINGARRWFDFRGTHFQPSELAKIALILVLAWYGDRCQRHMQEWKRGIFIPVLIVGSMLGLIFIEPDRGTTILLAGVSSVMLLAAGVRWIRFVPPILLGLAGLGFSLWHDPMRIRRIFGWLYLEEHKSGVGYQAYQAMLALGSGNWFGLGLGNGRQKLGFVPEHHTDFIFSIIGEELGLIATLLVVLAFVVLLACGIYIALKSADTFGFLLATGITFLIGMQAFINIGVVTSALPNKGLPLPFISYGGSNLLAMLTCVGLLFSVARRCRVPETVLERSGETGGLVPDPAT